MTIDSYPALKAVIADATLVEGLGEPCHYLCYETAQFDTLDYKYRKYRLCPIYFDHAFLGHFPGLSRVGPIDWLAEHFIAIIRDFTAKDAYGSVIALVRFILKYIPRGNMQNLIDQIRSDRQSTTPLLNTKAYNFLFIACLYADQPRPVWQFFIEECGADINFVTLSSHTPLHYVLRECAPANHMAFMQYGLEHGIDFNRPSRYNATPLQVLINRLIVTLNWPIDSVPHAIAFLLQHEATVLNNGNQYPTLLQRATLLHETISSFSDTKAIIPLLIQFGAWLVHPKHLNLSEYIQRRYPSSYILKQIPGFDLDRYNTAEVVLAGTDTTNGQLVWLDGMAEIKAVLHNPLSTVKLQTEHLRRQLQFADPELLGSPELLQEFFPIPSMFEMCARKVIATPGLLDSLRHSEDPNDQEILKEIATPTL